MKSLDKYDELDTIMMNLDRYNTRDTFEKAVLRAGKLMVELDLLDGKHSKDVQLIVHAYDAYLLNRVTKITTPSESPLK